MDIVRHIAKAEEAVQRKNPAFAIGLCRQILELDPSRARARACLLSASRMRAAAGGSGAVRKLVTLPTRLQLLIFRRLRKPKKVLRACDRILEKDPGDPGIAILAGETALSLGYDDAAIQILESLGKGAGGDPFVLKALGRLYQRKGQLDQALEVYEEALKVDPRDNEAQRARKNLAAEMALSRQGFESARSSRDLARDKEGAIDLEQSSRIARTPDEIRQRIAKLDKSGVREGQDTRALLELADLHTRVDEYSRAIEVLEKVAEQKPGDSDLEARIGDLSLLELDHEIKRLRREGGEGAKERIARLLDQHLELRINEYGRRVRQHPTDLTLRSRYGKALHDSGRVDEAIAEFQRAVNDPKGRIQALAHLGSCFRKKGLHDLAAKQYSQALEGASDAEKSTLELRYRLGEVLEEKGAAAEALAEYSRIYERDINFRDVARKIESLKTQG